MAGNLLFKRTDTGTDIKAAGSTWTLVDPAWTDGADAQSIGAAYKEGEYLLVSAAEEYSVIIVSVVTTITYDFYLTLVEDPAATGTPGVGNTLTVSNGDWTGDGSITYAYQWRTNTAADLTGTDAAIGGATAATHVLGSGETGKYVYCVVSATDDDTTLSADSNVLGPIT